MRLLLTVATILCSTTLFAATAPASAAGSLACVQQYVRQNTPQGKASLNKLIFHVYDARFWTDSPDGKWSMDYPHALHLTYFVDIDAEDFLDRTLEELQHNPEVSEAMLGKYKAMLARLYPDVKDGDSITAAYSPAQGMQLCLNGKHLGNMTDNALIEPFFGIWLGKHSSEPKLRDGLLGVRAQ